MTQSNMLIDIHDLHTYFYLREGIVRACDGVSYSIKRGKTLGIVGESGCGKSVTAQSIMQIVPKPGKIVSGSIVLHRHINGNEALEGTEDITITKLDPVGPEMREIRGGVIGMIFQEPMACLSPVHNIGSQIAETVLLHQEVTKQQARDMAIEMMQRVGIVNPIRNYRSYPHELSGGMAQRAVIAMTLISRPRLLIADEPTTSLDVTTEAQILRLMQELQADLGMAVMIITHDLGVIAKMAQDVAVMYLGKIVENAEVDAIFHDPKHPYLHALLKSIPRIVAKSTKRLESIKGIVPNPFAVPSGCPFHPRCPDFMEGICDVEIPPYTKLDGIDHWVACHLYSTHKNPSKQMGA